MKGDRFWAARDRRAAVNKADADGLVADSMEVRMALMQRVHDGEITLEQAQSELKKIKRDATKNGQSTRSRVWSQS